MRKSRFTEEQIVATVRESEREGVTVAQVARKHGITETTLLRWHKPFQRPRPEPGGRAAPAAARERAPEEGGRPADAGRGHPQGDQRKEMVSAQARRDQVDFAVCRGASLCRSCALLTVSRSAQRYVSRMPARDATLEPELRRISDAHPRYGPRFAWALLRREGQPVNRKRVRPVWRALGLNVRRRKHRKIRTGEPRVLAPTGANQVWAYDFVFDTCGNGQKFKALTVVDEWARECLAIEVGTSIDAVRVIAVLERLFAEHGTPASLRSDNGPEFIARALRIWAMMKPSELSTIEPGKPWQNGSVESFNGTFRAECLDREWFAHLREARIVIEQWRWEYNTQRPHSSLGYRTPSEVGGEARVGVHPITTENLS